MNSIQKEREAFEVWYCKNHTGLKQSDLAKFRTLSGYSFSDSLKINISWEAWQAAKAQAVPEGYVMVPKCLYCNGYGEVGCRFEGTFTCPECNGDRINLKAVIEAQEST
ncbi:hypothetical protein E3H47_04625 [Acinetobacter radioresistens]|uniref:hypothetical protein n=1 Tax=Acinetobacter radioresistens TaxID=40216 RepID=UPI0010CD3677|nr:hypothetical protein [Acinetobacter radioresistens]QCS11845.1 hypothetical protein E3H47_04625 [Acinetobacter radioresistens]